jgi:hypothetical protein
MARNGKIAHLPRPIRNELNSRLDNGEPGPQILEWLNGLDEVFTILDDFFDGKPINENNLSAWRQGGFLDWKRHQQPCDWVRTVSERADQVSEEAGLMPLSDRVSSLASLALGKLLQGFDVDTLPKDADRREFHALMKDLVLLRREDREAARLRIELERHIKNEERELRASLAAAAYCVRTNHPAASLKPQ